MPRSLAWVRLVAAFLLVAFPLLVPSGRVSADLLLNEVLYDPDGPDEGFEFVELWNPDSTDVPLEGISIEAGDGARPGSWSLIYTGAAGDSARPRRAFLVPGSALRAAIQNGPDALRLTRAGMV
ncbi:MAG TPA: lamin tail domain-containing protein, partial [Methylomirabilota bacterium]|nr:lamin tail domain-containing protein [Methylomirabilota bacterium]